MAKRLAMSESALSQLIGKTPTKRLGDRQARAIEKKLGLAPGWLDTENHDLTQESGEIARKYQHLTPAQKRVVRELLDTYRK